MLIRPADALARLPGPPNELWPAGARSVSMFRHGTLEAELYAPQGNDPQQPHTRDEVYVVISGHGQFDNGGEVQRFEAGDMLFVPAGRAHRFTAFSEDFSTWVLFYGPQGGEQP